MNKVEAENRGLDQDLFNFIRNHYDSQACHQTMDIKITYLGKGIAGIKKCPNLLYSTDGGRMHGGIIATLADIVMGAAAETISGQLYRTMDMNINYLAPVLEENGLTAEGWVIHPGHTVAVVEGNLFDNDRKLIAKSRGTYIRDTKNNFFMGN